MNTFGRMLRVSVLGESHGECVGVLLDGCPAGLELSGTCMLQDLARRKGGSSGTTQRKEEDEPLIKSGVLDGRTTGAPILILFENGDVDSTKYESARNVPRPGHADFVSMEKFKGWADLRGGGHFSGRLTAGIVAAGAIAKRLMPKVEIRAQVVEVGGSAEIERIAAEAAKEGDSVGGLVECNVMGVPTGLGEPFFDSVESLLAHALLSIPAVKGVEFGAGFASAKMRGSECNDAIVDASGKTATNNCGGINGGITNGNELAIRIAVKPASSIRKTQRTVDFRSGAAVPISVEGRHDACIALRMPVVAEAMVALVLADLMLAEQRIPRVLR